MLCYLGEHAIFGSRHGHDKARDEELSSLSSRLAQCSEGGFSVISSAPWSTERRESYGLKYAARNGIAAGAEPVVNSAEVVAKIPAPRLRQAVYGSNPVTRVGPTGAGPRQK